MFFYPRALALYLVLAGALFADQEIISDYGTARSIFWDRLYPSGGVTLYCGERFTDKAELNIEHVYPASWMARYLKCGSRKTCRKSNARFNRMEADLHNLFPSRADVNRARSNYEFGIVQGEKRQFKACDFEYSAKRKLAEPRPTVRGDIARALLYMAEEYGLPLLQPKTMLLDWHNSDPPDGGERWRNQQIKGLQGNSNPYIEPPQ